MARSSKPKSRRWEITPADLPTERAQAAEPRLRDLENNPVFRLYTLRRGKTVRVTNQPKLIQVLLLNAFLVFMALIGQIRWSLAALLAAICWIAQLISSSEPADARGGFYRDLCLTSLKPEDYVNGVWASMVSRRACFWRRITFWVLVILIAAVGSGYYYWLDAEIRLLCAAGLFILGVPVAFCFNDPYYALPAVHRLLQFQRRVLERKARPVAAVFEHGFKSILASLFFMILIAVGSVVVFTLEITLSQNERLLSNLSGGVIALALGLTVGWGYAVFVKKRMPKYLAKMDENVRKILELQRLD